MNRKNMFVALTISVLMLVTGAAAQEQNENRTVRCGNGDDSRQYCKADTSNGVRLSRQLSTATCTQGSSWGYDSNGIWVSDGCSADFIVAGSSYNNGGYNNGTYGNNQGDNQNNQGVTRDQEGDLRIRCESNTDDNQRNYCPGRSQEGEARLQRQLSQTQCTQGSNWGQDDQGIWVSNGCSAVFELQSNTANGGSYNNGGYQNQNQGHQKTVRCQATNNGNKRKYCTADTRGGVRLTQQLSSRTCTQGSTWGYDSRGVWVSRGCGGVFQVTSNTANGGYNNNGYGVNSGRGTYAQTIHCDSNGNARNYCAANAQGGAKLTRQTGQTTCRQGQNWGYDNSGVWVSNGCSGDFQVYGNIRNASGQYSTYTTIPSGTQISVRTNEAIDSNNARSGQRYSASIAEDVSDSNGQVVIPRGSDAEMVIVSANGDNNTTGSGSNNSLVLGIDSVTVNGTRYRVSTTDMSQGGGTGIGKNKKTGEMVGGGAILGALIGAIAGGGKGAAIGAAVGAGAGAGGVVLTRGKQVNVPVETVLNFKLDQDLQLQQLR